jgi:eukaryotic-like serine/threonine-protein kinase
MSLGDRLRWMLRMAMLLFILASVAFLSALTAMRFAIRGREVQMPDLVGMPASEARPLLQSLRLGLKVEDRIYSQWPVDAVVRQSPLPSMNVKVGQDAHVVLSLGPQKVTIPELEDKSVRAAQVELLRAGMQLGEVSNLYLPASNPDTVARHERRHQFARRFSRRARAAAACLRHARFLGSLPRRCGSPTVGRRAESC